MVTFCTYGIKPLSPSGFSSARIHYWGLSTETHTAAWGLMICLGGPSGPQSQLPVACFLTPVFAPIIRETGGADRVKNTDIYGFIYNTWFVNIVFNSVLSVCVSEMVCLALNKWDMTKTEPHLFNIGCQAVIEGHHLLPLIGSSHHKSLVLCCSGIQVQFWPKSHGHTKAQRSHTAVEGTREEYNHRFSLWMWFFKLTVLIWKLLIHALANINCAQCNKP